VSGLVRVCQGYGGKQRILPGGVRVLSQRATLRAIGASGQDGKADRVLKNTDKNRGAKLNVSSAENATNQGDFKGLGRGAKLQFLPPVGGTAIKCRPGGV